MTAKLAVGDPAPSFSLTDAHGNDGVAGRLRRPRVVVYFYPAA